MQCRPGLIRNCPEMRKIEKLSAVYDIFMFIVRLTKIQQQGKAKQRLKNLRRKKEIEQKNLLYPATNSSTTNPSYLEADYYYAAGKKPNCLLIYKSVFESILKDGVHDQPIESLNKPISPKYNISLDILPNTFASFKAK